nr:MAG TPA: hypothetical protein [Caudoviricetes sp.]
MLILHEIIRQPIDNLVEIKKHHFRDVDKKRTAIKAVVYKTVALAN